MKTLAAALVASGLSVAMSVEAAHARDPEVVARVSTPEFPRSIFPDPFRGRVIAAGLTAAFVIDANTHEVAATLPEPLPLDGSLAHDPVSGRTVVVNSGAKSVTIFNGAVAEHVLQFDEPIYGAPIDPFPGRVLVVGSESTRVSVIDLLSGSIVNTFDDLPLGTMVIDPLRGEIYVLSGGQIAVFDTGASRVTRIFPAVVDPLSRISAFAVDPLSRRLYLAHEDSLSSRGNFILVLDADTGVTIAVVGNLECSVRGHCERCEINPCEYLLAVDPLSDRVIAVSTRIGVVQALSGGLLSGQADTWGFPWGISVNSFTSRALIGTDAMVSQVLDVASLDELARVETLGLMPAVDPLRDEWYAAGYSDSGPTVDVVAGFEPARARFIGEITSFLARIPAGKEAIRAPLQAALSALSDTNPDNDADIGRLIGAVLVKVERGSASAPPAGVRPEVRDAARRLAMTYLAAAGYAP